MMNSHSSTSLPDAHKTHNVVTESSKAIISQYFSEKLQKIKTEYMEIFKVIEASEIGSYGGLEFNEIESNFLIKYLNITTGMITVPITKQDWNNIGTLIANNLRTSKAGDEVASILQSINITELAQEFFSSHECNFSSESFSFSARHLLDLVRGRILEGLDNLFHDSMNAYLLFMKDEAVSIKNELTRSIAKREIAEYTKLQESLLGEITRHKMIDVCTASGVSDKISIEYFNVPISYISDSDGSFQEIKFSPLNDEKPYNDLPQGFFPFVKRNNGASIMTFFFGESPYRVLTGMTHWANLVTDSGPFKDAIITSEDIKQHFFDYIHSFMIDESMGLRVVQQGANIQGLGIPEFITFEVMTPQEISAEKLKRSKEKKGDTTSFVSALVKGILSPLKRNGVH